MSLMTLWLTHVDQNPFYPCLTAYSLPEAHAPKYYLRAHSSTDHFFVCGLSSAVVQRDEYLSAH